MINQSDRPIKKKLDVKIQGHQWIKEMLTVEH